ncbi:MAG TPA: hypothetical protein DHI91_02900 [Candidatus Portnoybacteria bacterium]|nr:hypothetical protein [Candidatus Portnoybacteria bacterium]
MTSLEKAIITPIIYYDLLDRPLTALEIFKYLPAVKPEVSFFQIQQTLASSDWLAERIKTRQGLYFLKKRDGLLALRGDRLKLSQLKWKKLRTLVKRLALVPFLKLVAVTGSLTAYNTQPSSDFDLLVVAQSDRLWTARTFLTALTAMLGIRRHGRATRDRLCLNCYLTQAGLEIKHAAKPHDFHSAQEYGRMTPVLEIADGLYQQFLTQNSWLKDFLAVYPWSNFIGAKKITPSPFLGILRRIAEWLLGDRIGERLEKTFGRWQGQRIRLKNENQPDDQIYTSSTCLMFHPHSKSYQLLQVFNQRLASLI